MISIVIVNWNSGKLLNACLKSIDRFSNGLVESVVVVDNASVDGSADMVEVSKFKLIRARENLGFAGACNMGAHGLESKYLLFLNPDAALYSDTLPSVVNFIESEICHDVGICGVQLIDDNNKVSRSCARFPSVKSLFIHAIGLGSIFPTGGHFMTEWDHLDTRIVDQVIGAFFLVRNDLFKDLKGFDEQFFVYYEEVDFAYRALQLGMKSAFFSGSSAYHSGGGTSKQVKARRLFYSLRSRILYVCKNFSTMRAATVLIITLIFEPISRAVYSLCQLSFDGFKETLSAYLMLWKWLPQWVFRGVTR